MFTLNCGGRLLQITRPLVMGIINVTPDSFYAGSRFQGSDAVIAQAEKMLADGADLLDIGAQSTRPGSDVISAAEEVRRLIPAIAQLHRHFPEAVLSADTYRSEVAREAVGAGASMVNDIGGGNFDAEMINTVGALRVPYVCMHVRGNPDTKHQHPPYENITREVVDYFIEKTDTCLKAGITDLILDPGFGFSKTIADNFRLMQDLGVFQIFNKPVLVGISRKSTIYKTLRVTVEEALNGTTVMHTYALLHGANILRVHDVKEAVEAVKLLGAIKPAIP